MAILTYQKNAKTYYEVYINGQDANGKRFQRRKKGIDSRRKATAIEFEFKRELAKAKEQGVSYRWQEWLEIYLDRKKLGWRPSTGINYRSSLNKWVTPNWKNLELSEITKSDVYEIVFNKANTLNSSYSQKNLLKMIKRVFQMAVDDGYIARNPCTGIEIKTAEVEQKVLTASEAIKFLNEAKSVNHRFYPVWVMALMTGMRSGEMFALKWTDVDLDSKLISVTRQWTSKNGFGPTKTKMNRIVPISDELLSFLKVYKLERPSDSEYVLPHLSEWERGEQARVTRDFCKCAGVTEVKFHDLRATFITNLLARGESLARVMAIVGHAELRTTNGYLRRAGVDVKGVTNSLGYVLPKDSSAKVINLRES